MKAKYALMTVALSLATFSHAQNVPQKATEILESLSVPVQTPAISLEQRVAKMPNLALVPADASACFAILNVGPTTAAVIKSPSLSSMIAPSDVPALLTSIGSFMEVKDIIIAGDEKLGKLVATATPLLSVLQEGLNNLAVISVLQRVLGYGKSVEGAAQTELIPSLIKPGAVFLKEAQIAPVLAVASMEPDVLIKCQSNITQGVDFLVNVSQGICQLHKGKYQGYDFSGVKLDGEILADTIRKIQSELSSEGISEQALEPLLASMAKHNLYVLFAFKDDKVIVSISADPATEIKIAATPKDSILATDKFAFTDHVAHPLMLGYCGASFYAALMQSSIEMNLAQVKGYAKGVETAAREGNIGDISGAIAAWKLAGDNYIELSKMHRVDRPCTMALWWDKGVQVEMTAAGSEALQTDKILKLASYADQADNIVYAAANFKPAYTAKGLAVVENAVSAVWQFAERALPVAVQHAEKDNTTIRAILQALPLVQMCKPELLKIWSSAKLALSGMDSDGVLIVDAQGMLPQIPVEDMKARDLLKELQVPRFAYAKGVTDRSKISSAWDQMTSSMEELIASFSPPVEGESNPMAIANPHKTEVKGVANYTYPSPFFTAECKPCLSISDKVFVFGSSPSLNQSVAEAMTAPPTGNLKGAALAVKLAPVSKMIQSYVKFSLKMKPDQDPEPINSVLDILKHFDGLYGVTTDGETSRMRLSIPMK